jgi:hypothetical protein
MSDTTIRPWTATGTGITTRGKCREEVLREAAGTFDFFIQVQVTSSSSPGSFLDELTSGLCGLRYRRGHREFPQYTWAFSRHGRAAC